MRLSIAMATRESPSRQPVDERLAMAGLGRFLVASGDVSIEDGALHGGDRLEFSVAVGLSFVSSGAGEQSAVGGDHRRWAFVHGTDDLGVVDAAKIDGGDREIGVPELTLNDQKRDTLARHLHRVRMAQLMRREAAPSPPRGRLLRVVASGRQRVRTAARGSGRAECRTTRLQGAWRAARATA